MKKTEVPAAPPTVEQILAHYAQAKGYMAGPDKTQTLTLKGIFTSRDGLEPMQLAVLIKVPDKWLMTLQGTNGYVWRRGFDGSVAWEISKWGPPNVGPSTLAGSGWLRALSGRPVVTLLLKLSYKGTEPIGEGQAYVVEAALPGQPARLWFDPQTGLLSRIEWASVAPCCKWIGRTTATSAA